MTRDGYKQGRRRSQLRGLKSRPLSTARGSTHDFAGTGQFLLDVLSTLARVQDVLADELVELWAGASEADEHNVGLVTVYHDLRSLLENPALSCLCELIEDVLPKTTALDEWSA